MRYRIDYTPTESFPHVPKAVLAMRLEAKLAPPEPGGCRLWQGAVRKRGDNAPEVGTMRLKGPERSVLVTAPAVAWFLAGHPWPADDTWLKRACGRALCCHPGHLTPCKKVDRRKMTADQVLEARQLFWAKDGRRQRLLPRLPERLVQDELGLSSETVRRVVAGLPVDALAWRREGLTVAMVKEAYLDAQEACRVRQDKHAAAWTYQRLADKYNVSLASVQSAVNGFAYRDVPGPTSAQEAARWANPPAEVAAKPRPQVA